MTLTYANEGHYVVRVPCSYLDQRKIADGPFIHRILIRTHKETNRLKNRWTAYHNWMGRQMAMPLGGAVTHEQNICKPFALLGYWFNTKRRKRRQSKQHFIRPPIISSVISSLIHMIYCFCVLFVCVCVCVCACSRTLWLFKIIF